MDVLLPGAEIDGRYRIRGVIGAGGMGVVYDADDLSFERRVAIKLLLKAVERHAGAEERFVREARAAARVQHPGLAQVFELGSHEGASYFVMERLDGEDLDARIEREGPLSVAETVRIGIEAAEAVAAAHESNIVHRDLKPKNLFLARYGRKLDVVKVLDFGVAKLIEPGAETLTHTGQVFGTLRYMPPEQLRDAKRVDLRADVYALGAVLYECLAGQPAFPGDSGPELVLRIVTESPPPLATLRSDLPQPLLALVDKAMARDPNARFASARELADALEQIQPGSSQTPPSRRGSLGLASTVSAAPDAYGASGSAGVLNAGDPARRRVLWSAAAALSGLLTFAGWHTLRQAEPAAAPALVAQPPVADSSVKTDSEPASKALEAPVQPETRRDEGEPDGGEAPTQVVSVTSIPPGAKLKLNGADVCVAPCGVEIVGAAATLVARLRGHDSIMRKLEAPFPSSLELVLRPKPSSPDEPPALPTR